MAAMMNRPDLDTIIRQRVNGTLNDVHLREVFAYIEALEQEQDALRNGIAEIERGDYLAWKFERREAGDDVDAADWYTMKARQLLAKSTTHS